MKSILNTLYKTADFNSRSTRKELIYYVVFLVVFALIISILDLISRGFFDYDFGKKFQSASFLIVNKFFIVFIICLIPLITLLIRRLHDINASGLYIGIPIVIELGLRFAGYTNSPIEKGIRLVIVAILIFLCFKNSYPKDNDHGKHVSTIKKKPENIIKYDS